MTKHDAANRIARTGAEALINTDSPMTDRSRLELQLQQTKARLQRALKTVEQERAEKAALLDSSAEGALVIDLEGRCTFINRAGADIFGNPPKEIVGKTLRDLFHGHRPASSSHSSQECPPWLISPTDVSVNQAAEVIWRPDGTSFPVEVTFSPVRDRGQVVAVAVTLTDCHTRRGVDQALQDSEARYRTIVESAQEGISITDAEGRVTFVNHRLADMLGYSPDEMLGSSMYSLMPPEAVPIADAGLAHLRESGVNHLDFPMRRRDGSEVWGIVSANQLTSADGSHAGVLAMITDITDRKRAELELATERAKLRASEERFRTLARDVADVFLISGPDATIHYHSPAVQNIWGYGEGAVEGTSVLDMVHPDDRAAAQSVLDQACSRPAAKVDSEIKVRYADGSWHACEVIASNLLADPNILGIVLTFHDISERKNSELRHRTIVESAQEGIWIIDAEGRTTVVNRRLGDMFGYAPDEMLGRSLFSFMDQDAEAIAKASLARQREGMNEHLDFRFRRRDGTVLWAIVSATPLTAADGSYVGGLAMVTDITDRKRTEDELTAERAALRASEERFRTLARDVADVLFISDSNGAILYQSPAVQHVWGYEESAVRSTSVLEMVHPDDRIAAQSTLRQAGGGNSSKLTCELRVQYADGSLHAAEVIASNLLADPNIRGIVLTFHDISERKASEARYRSIVESAQEGISITDPMGRITFVNHRLAEMLACSPNEMLGQSMFAFMDRETVPLIEALRKRLRKGFVERLDIPLRRQDGTQMWAIIAVSPLTAANGSYAGGLTMVTDITDRKRAEQELAVERAALRASEERFRTLARDVADVFLVSSSDGMIIYHSPAVQLSWGYGEVALKGTSVLDLIDPDDRAAAQAMLGQASTTTAAKVKSEVRLHYADDSWHSCEVIASNLLADPNIGGIVLTFHDISERKTYEQELTRLAFHDALSGLPNRALFRERLENALTRSVRWRRSVSVIFLDLDGFKVVNDSLGHKAGDELLNIVGQRLVGSLRAGDTVARLGGDEFTILLEDIGDPQDAVFVADHVLEALHVPVLINEREVFISASLGIAMSGPGANTAELLMRNADLAMYRAKTTGKDRVEIFDSSMNASALQRLDIESDLHGALEHGEFRILYQPILQLESGIITEVEALLRWEHPRRGLVSPLEFIPACEETGLIVPIGRWVIEQVCLQARQWLDETPIYPPLVVGVNLSPRQFVEPALISDVRRALEAARLPAAHLRVEITESLLMESSAAVIANLNGLKALGVQIAIDDFGTGYSSMSYLKRLPIDLLKIDRSFIDGLEEPQSTAIVRSMIELAKSLNLSVTGEGIETADQLQRLRDLGCNMGQGFLFEHPVLPNKITEILAAAAIGKSSLTPLRTSAA